jgi:hypothetical protein
MHYAGQAASYVVEPTMEDRDMQITCGITILILEIYKSMELVDLYLQQIIARVYDLNKRKTEETVS